MMKYTVILLLCVLPALTEGWWNRRYRRTRRPVNKNKYLGHCNAWGDPHYTTFDKKSYNFQGVCRYVHATDYCHQGYGSKASFGTFKVIADNELCGRKVSCIKQAEVYIRGEKILLTKAGLPNKETNNYSVKNIGGKVIVETKPAGLKVEWNKVNRLHISLTGKYKSKVCGLCGNFDGNRANDKPDPNKWQAGKAGKCPPGPTIPKHPCENKPKRHALAAKDCALIKSKHFKSCKDGGLDVNLLYDNCVYDVCEQEGSDVLSSCEAIKETADECKEKTGKTVSLGYLEKKCGERVDYVGHCNAWGDPHYTTFDKKIYNFQGVCRYVQLTDYNSYCRKGYGNSETFKIIADNELCGNKVSCIKQAEVYIRGEKILLTKAGLPNKDADNYSVKNKGGKVIVETKPAGLKLEWDKKNKLHISLTASYKGKVCGLCGNFDGNLANDVTNPNDWQVAEAGKKCKPGPRVPDHPCEDKPHRRALAEKDCALIKSNHFKSCKDGGLNVDALYNNCLYDVCLEGQADVVSSCEAIREAADECKEKTGKTVSLGHLEEECTGECRTQVKLFNTCEIKCCKFPFKKDGIWYNKCANSPHGPGPWCSSEKIATSNSLGLCITNSQVYQIPDY